MAHEVGVDQKKTETRCSCGRFILQVVLAEGRSIFKVVCHSCGKKLLVSITQDSVTVGQV